MIRKYRTEPIELKIMRSLNTRMNLTPKENQYYLNQEKGYEGEVMFDLLTENLHGDIIILNDLLLEHNNSVFQIDTLIITQETVNLFEVKNYEGDFYYKSDRFYTISGKEIKEPLQQMKRCESLLRQLLQNLGFNFPIEAYLIFINPEFSLYQAPLNQSIIFPTQLNRFMKKLNMIHSLLNERNKKLADHLVSLHLKKSPFSKVPNYDYEQLQKGIICAKCNSFLLSCGERKILCDKCGHEEKVESAIMRSVKELKLLFPDRKITTNAIFEWCKVVESKKLISRILKQKLNAKGYGQWSYYE